MRIHRSPRSLFPTSALVAAFLGAGLPGGGIARAGEKIVDAGRGPVTVYLPSSYDPEVPTPLVLLLHGYSSSGQNQEAYMRFLPLSEEYGFLYAHPDGLVDLFGNRFWNATDACCDFFDRNPDDSGYLLALIDAIKAECNVNPRRVHLIGHSNGGFMSHRMACDHPDVIASIASLAGATHENPNDCAPAESVHILEIHGTADLVIRYDGGCTPGGCYPGAVATVEQWATFNGCSLEPDRSPPPLDLDAGVQGAETQVARYDRGCNVGGSAELWSIVGGAHSPSLTPDFGRYVIEYLFAHPAPCVRDPRWICDGDVDGNGTVNPVDVGLVQAAFCSTDACDDVELCQYDVDCNGAINPVDAGIVQSRFGVCDPPRPECSDR
jgi:polyhydroxybutyrate depolymerase